MSAWFNKKTAQAMAKLTANLKAESQARAEAEQKLKAAIEAKAEIERKVKAEAEKLLLAQFNRYNSLVEKAEAKAKEAMAEAKLKMREAEEKVLSYEVELAKARERLDEANELMNNHALARAKAEENLLIESEQRKKVEADLEEAMVIAGAKAREDVQPFVGALTDEKEKLIEAEEQAGEKAVTEIEESVKTEIKKRQKYFEQPVERVYKVKRVRRRASNSRNIKKRFFILLVIVIISVITVAFTINNNQLADEPVGFQIKETADAKLTLTGSQIDRERQKSGVKSEILPWSSSRLESDMTTAPALKYKSVDDVTGGISIPVIKTRTLTITASPASLRITTSAGIANNVVRFSDNDRLETRAGSSTYYEFSDVSIPADTVVKSAVLFVEHFEEERFAEGQLEWTIGSGRPDKPAVWAVMKAPIHEGESTESVDAWDITRVLDEVEKINSLQLQITNNNIAHKKTFVDYAYVVVKY